MSYQQPQQGYNAPSFGSNVPSTSSQVPTNIAGEEPSKLGGFSDRVMGAAKETAGKLFGNPELEAKGQAQRNIGQTEIQGARDINRVQGQAQQVTGAAKEQTGYMTGQPGQQMSGTAERKIGEARERWNQ